MSSKKRRKPSGLIKTSIFYGDGNISTFIKTLCFSCSLTGAIFYSDIYRIETAYLLPLQLIV
jgi:hypothetical protein